MKFIWNVFHVKMTRLLCASSIMQQQCVHVVKNTVWHHLIGMIVCVYVRWLSRRNRLFDGLRCGPQQSQHCAIYLMYTYVCEYMVLTSSIYRIVWMSFHELGTKRSNNNYDDKCQQQQHRHSAQLSEKRACLLAFIHISIFQNCTIKMQDNDRIYVDFGHVLREYMNKWLSRHARAHSSPATTAQDQPRPHLFIFYSIFWILHCLNVCVLMHDFMNSMCDCVRRNFDASNPFGLCGMSVFSRMCC